MDPLKFDKILGLNKDELDQVARSKPGWAIVDASVTIHTYVDSTRWY